ncbi:MAG: VacJ family lipoprotein [Woeseia sp.]
MKKQSTKSLLVAFTCTALLAACATSGTVAPPEQRSPADPWEPLNRRIDSFNTTVDKATLKPLAKAYRAVLPVFARRGISNFFENLGTPAVALNNTLQGKPGAGLSDLGRFVFNSTLGIGGLFDIAAPMGLPKHDEDFGQTFAVWGAGSGPYLVLPMLGPSTLRDTLAKPFDFASNPLFWYENSSVKDKLRVLNIIDTRARLLNAEGFLENSNDPYITLRESYLQNRNYKIHDGNPPVEDDFYDDLLEE